jgi:hypothetical protein
MKIEILKFILWMYENHIQEDWDDYNKIGKIIVYPAWFIRSCLIWALFPLWIPSYLFSQSKAYEHYTKFGKMLTSKQQMEMIKQQRINRKIERDNFLIQRQSKGKYNRKF